MDAAQQELRRQIKAAEKQRIKEEEEERKRRRLASKEMENGAGGEDHGEDSLFSNDSSENYGFSASTSSSGSSSFRDRKKEGSMDGSLDKSTSSTLDSFNGEKPVWTVEQRRIVTGGNPASTGTGSLDSPSSSEVGERNRTIYADGTTVIAFHNEAIVILEPDGSAWCWVQVCHLLAGMWKPSISIPLPQLPLPFYSSNTGSYPIL